MVTLSSDESAKPTTRRTARMGKMHRSKSRTTGTESIHSASESVTSSTSSGVHSSGKLFLCTSNLSSVKRVRKFVV